MLKAIEGIYDQGMIRLKEEPIDMPDATPVVVTFLTPQAGTDLRQHGIRQDQAADLRARLATFAEDWEHPEMDVYDDYDAARVEPR